MDNIIEVIFTLIVGFFWLFGGSFFKNRKDEESLPSAPSRSNKKTESDRASSDHESRQQEIREAIRRKIAERRQQNDPGSVVVAEPETNYQQQYESVEPKEVVEEPAIYVESEREPVEGAFSWNVENNAYEQEMQKRLEEIEATKRKAEALKEKVKRVQRNDSYDTDQKESEQQATVLSLGSVRSALKNKTNARAAFVYAEILGKPIGLRRSSEN